MIKILAIGNSFSEDTTALLQIVNPNIYVRNLYIGGCSLATHYENIEGNLAKYEYQENGAKVSPFYISIKDALLKEKWDFITIQQVSGEQGLMETITPYLSKILDYIKKYSKAKILYHQTWAYQNYSSHPCFSNYQNSEDKMYESIKNVTKQIKEFYNLDIIPTGDVIYKLRRVPYFDYLHNGLSLHRDDYMHLSINYGRYVGAYVWSYIFTKEVPNKKLFNSKQYNIINEFLKTYFNC